MELVPHVYGLLRKFPKHEQYALADQIRRSAISIPANIAEGQGRQHPAEFRQFLSIARGSIAELHTLILLARKLEYISLAQLQEIEASLSGVRKPLYGLINQVTP